MFIELVRNLTSFLEVLKHQSNPSLSVPMQSIETLIALVQDSVFKNVPQVYLPQSIVRICACIKEIQEEKTKDLDQNGLVEGLGSDWLRLTAELSQEISVNQDFYLRIFAEIRLVTDISVSKSFIESVIDPSKPLIVAWYFDRHLIFHLVECCLSEEESKAAISLNLLFNGLKFLSNTGKKNVCYGEVLIKLYKDPVFGINPVIHCLIKDLLMSEVDIFTPKMQANFSSAILDYDDLFIALALSFHTIPRQQGLGINVHKLFDRLLEHAGQPTMLGWHRILTDHAICTTMPPALFEQFQLLFPVSAQTIDLDDSSKFQESCELLGELFPLYFAHIRSDKASLYRKNLIQVFSKLNKSIHCLDTKTLIELLPIIQTCKVEYAQIFLSTLMNYDAVHDFFNAIYLRSLPQKKASDIQSGFVLLLAEQKLLSTMTRALRKLESHVKPPLVLLDMGSADVQRVLLIIMLLVTRVDMYDQGFIEFPAHWLQFFTLIMKNKFMDPLSTLKQKSEDVIESAIQKNFDAFLTLIQDIRYVDYLPATVQNQFLTAIKPVDLSHYEQQMANLLAEEERELQQAKVAQEGNLKTKKKKKPHKVSVDAASSATDSPTNIPPDLAPDEHAIALLETVRSFRWEEETPVAEVTPETASEESGLALSHNGRGSASLSVVSSPTNHSTGVLKAKVSRKKKKIDLFAQEPQGVATELVVSEAATLVPLHAKHSELEVILEPVQFNAQHLTTLVRDLQKRSIPLEWKKQLNLVITQLAEIQDLLPLLELPELIPHEEFSQDSMVVLAASEDRLQWEKNWGVVLGNYCESIALGLDKIEQAIAKTDGIVLLGLGEPLQQRLLSHLSLLSRCYFQDPELQIDPRFWAIVKKLKTYFAHLQIDFFIKGSYFFRPMDAGDIDVVIAPKEKTPSFFVACDQVVKKLSMIEISKQLQYKVYRQSDAALIVSGVLQWKICVQLDEQHTLAFDLNFWHDPLTPQSELAKTVTAWFSACAVHWYPEGYAVMSPGAAVANYGGRLAMLKEPTRQEMPDIMGYALKTVIRFADLDADLWIRNFLAHTIAPATRTVDRNFLCTGLKYLFNHFDHRAFSYMQFIVEQHLISEVTPHIGMPVHQYCTEYFKKHFLENTAVDFSRVSAAQFLAMYFFGAVVDNTPLNKQAFLTVLSQSLLSADILQKVILLLRWMPQTTSAMHYTAMWYSWPINKAAWLSSTAPQFQKVAHNLLDIFSLWQRYLPAAQAAVAPDCTSRPERVMQGPVIASVQPALHRQGLFGGTAPASEGGKLSSVVAKDSSTKSFIPQ